MTLTVRAASITGAVTAARALTHAEMDANWAHVLDSANQSFAASGSGATARTVQDVLRERISVKDFGAVCDDSTDDTAAIQAAIDSVGDTSINYARAGVDIFIPGPCKITDTILIEEKGVRLVGNGWGARSDPSTARKSYLRWAGAAGSPMVKFKNIYSGGGGIHRLRLIGNSAAKPSAAIELNDTGSGFPNQSLTFDTVYCGFLSGESDVGDHFTDVVSWTGTDTNDSEMRFDMFYATGCTRAGLRQSGSQHLSISLGTAVFNSCGTGIYVCGHISGDNVLMLNNDVDFETPLSDDHASQVSPMISMKNYFSEGSGRMASFAGAVMFSVWHGSFNVSGSNADGKIVVHEVNSSLNFVLRDFQFNKSTAPAGTPYLALRNGSGTSCDKSIILDGIRGWSELTGGTNGLDLATRGVQDRRYIFFREANVSFSSNPIRVAQNFLHGTNVDWDPNRYHVKNDTGLKFHDDFLGDVLADQWGSAVGTDGAVVAPAVVAGEHGGMMRMTTGANASADMAGNGVQIHSALNWIANRGGLAIEFRLRIPTGITSLVVYAGFTDQIAALEMPFTLGASDTLTSNATDAVGILYDTAADNDNWWLVGVANNVDATKQNTGAAPPVGTYQTWRIELSSAGAATFYLNGVAVGTAMTGAVTATVALTPVIAAFRRGAATRDIECDYIHIEANRFT